jgi:hypothetical protein
VVGGVRKVPVARIVAPTTRVASWSRQGNRPFIFAFGDVDAYVTVDPLTTRLQPPALLP